jgi:hypothetical protein
MSATTAAIYLMRPEKRYGNKIGLHSDGTIAH